MDTIIDDEWWLLSADVRVLYEAPVRVFTVLPDTSIQLCDYLFKDETAAESVKRFHDLIGIDVVEGDVDQESEHLPGKIFGWDSRGSRLPICDQKYSYFTVMTYL